MVRALWVSIVAGCLAQAAEPVVPKAGGCEGPAPAAASFFVGELTVAEGVVSGTETWMLFPNEKWKALGATDCSITWKLTGSVAPPGKCTGCDLGLKIHAEPDRASSRCPADLVYGREAPSGQRVGGEANAFDEQYDVVRAPDGSATFHFGKTGKQFSSGWHAAERLGFTSNRQCKWF